MRYLREGTNGGYPLSDDETDEDYKWLYEHPCIACGKVMDERDLIMTEEGFLCKECYEFKINYEENERRSEKVTAKVAAGRGHKRKI